MTLLLGDTAPNFQDVETTQGKMADFYKWAGDSWVVLFSHPKAFTAVCTTELGAVAKLQSEFAKRNAKVIATSVDPIEKHKQWVNDIEETQGCNMSYPIIADSDRKIATLYGMVHPKESNDFTVRTVFIIDPDKKIRLTMTYPATTGRNFAEILRAVDSLQLTTKRKLATPANWQKGEECIIMPTVSDEEAKKVFPDFKTVKPYYRTTKQT